MCHSNQTHTPGIGCSPAPFPSPLELAWVLPNFLYLVLAAPFPLLGASFCSNSAFTHLSSLPPSPSPVAPLMGLSLCSCCRLNKHNKNLTTCIEMKLSLDNCSVPWAGFQSDFLRVPIEPEFLPRAPPTDVWACGEPEPFASLASSEGPDSSHSKRLCPLFMSLTNK